MGGDVDVDVTLDDPLRRLDGPPQTADMAEVHILSALVLAEVIWRIRPSGS